MLNPTSHRYAFTFLNSGKCGSCTIRNWFYRFLSESREIEDAGGIALDAMLEADLSWFTGSPFCLDDAEIESRSSYRKILFMRHPWERLVSGYYHLVVRTPSPQQAARPYTRGRTATLETMLRWRGSGDWRRRITFREFVSFLEENLEPLRRIVAATDRDFGSDAALRARVAEANDSERAALAARFEPVAATPFLADALLTDPAALAEMARILVYHVGVIAKNFEAVAADRIVDLEDLDPFLRDFARELGVAVSWPGEHMNVTGYASRPGATLAADLPFDALLGLGYNPPYRQFYDDGLARRTGQIYEADVHSLGYAFEAGRSEGPTPRTP